jgi:hypothetical protein
VPMQGWSMFRELAKMKQLGIQNSNARKPICKQKPRVNVYLPIVYIGCVRKRCGRDGVCMGS